ncbi:hypothetical protein GCM10020254_44340 [Streptomyces goshikiensis]
MYESYPAHDPCAGAVAADRLLARPDRPDAVYGLFDPNGTDLLAAARRYGLRVPEDLLLVCCSESTVYANTEPPITTLSLKPRRIGTAVVQLLIDAIEGVGTGRPCRTGRPDRIDHPYLLAAQADPYDRQPTPLSCAGLTALSDPDLGTAKAGLMAPPRFPQYRYREKSAGTIGSGQDSPPLVRHRARAAFL